MGAAHYLADANHNVTALASTSGEVVERYVYTPYGAITVLDADFSVDADTLSDVSNTTLYTGRTLDIETGLMYYRARYYHPELGKFTARDPIGFGGGDPNLYRYDASSPTVNVDPLGTCKVLSVRRYDSGEKIYSELDDQAWWWPFYDLANANRGDGPLQTTTGVHTRVDSFRGQMATYVFFLVFEIDECDGPCSLHWVETFKVVSRNVSTGALDEGQWETDDHLDVTHDHDVRFADYEDDLVGNPKGRMLILYDAPEMVHRNSGSIPPGSYGERSDVRQTFEVKDGAGAVVYTLNQNISLTYWGDLTVTPNITATPYQKQDFWDFDPVNPDLIGGGVCL